jgi:penicillin-binding protein 1C
MRDNWALGYSDRYTVGVWVGNASGAPMWDVSGTTGAAPIWAAVMHYLHQGVPSRAPKPPAGVVRQAVTFTATAPALQSVALGRQTPAAEAVEASRLEWFMQGTEQSRVNLRGAGTATGKAGMGRITAPANGSIIALDPDIPPARQRLRFTSDTSKTNDGSAVRWLLDGKPLARGDSTPWLPWPGRHVVQLVSSRGDTLDEIRIEVRGAGVVTRP